jgi:hypothetical protein
MVKDTKFFRKQARKANQAAARASDSEVEADLHALARAYRSQADVLKRKKRDQRAKRSKAEKKPALKQHAPRK